VRRSREEIVSPIDIVSPAFMREVHTIAHGGENPIFDFSPPKKNAVVSDALTIHQHDAHGRHDGVDDVWLSVNERGVIEIESNITSRRPSGAGLLGAPSAVARPGSPGETISRIRRTRSRGTTRTVGLGLRPRHSVAHQRRAINHR